MIWSFLFNIYIKKAFLESKMKLYLVRHGRTNCNDRKIRDDSPKTRVMLNSLGKTQAEKASKELRKCEFDVIYCSELLRCRQTAKMINKFHDKKIILDKRLNEHNTGFDKRLNSDLLKARSKSKNPFEYKPNVKGSESQKDVMNRVKGFINKVKSKNYKKILIVGHGGVLENIYKLKTGKDYYGKGGKKGMRNCEMMIVDL